jgi:hypothetical protein
MKKKRSSTNLVRTLAVSGLLPLCASCSTTKLAVGAMIPILENTKTVSLASNDIRTFKAATPSSILLLEGLAATEPGNDELRISLAMMYFAYAFTLDEAEDEDYASSLYAKGFEHGKVALFDNDEIEAAWDGPFNAFATAAGRVEDRDLEALVWTVANWSQFISLHLDSTEVLVQIPRVTALLERAVELDGSFFGGLPHIILASLHAFRPPMLGGDVEASKDNFDTAISLTDGRFLLAHYFMARFYCHRIQDPDMFEQLLTSVIRESDDIWPEYRLLNALAIEKSDLLLEEKDDLF